MAFGESKSQDPSAKKADLESKIALADLRLTEIKALIMKTVDKHKYEQLKRESEIVIKHLVNLRKQLNKL